VSPNLQTKGECGQSGAAISGVAVIYLRTGVFVASHAELDRDLLTFTGRLRIRDLTGERRYPERTRTVRLSRGERIDWQSVEESST
jgi:hypothetical protein